MEEENLFEYEGVSYPESALREIYPETFDEYVEQGILKKLGDEEAAEVEDIQEESLYEYEGVSYPESSLRDLYPNDFDDYVEQGVLTKVDGLGKPIAVEDSAAARDMDLVSEDGLSELQEEDTWLERTFGKNEFTDFFGDIYRAGKQGFLQAEAVDPSLNIMTAGEDASVQDLYNYVQTQRRIQKGSVESDEMKDFNRVFEESGGGALGFLMGVLESPTVLPSLFVSSMATQIGSLASEEVAASTAAGAGTGAAVGSAIPIPLIGTSTGALGGGFAGLATAMEAGLTFSELLQEEIDGEITIDKVQNILQDPEKLSELRRKAVGRGAAIGAVEALSAGLASKATKAVAGAVKKGKSVAGRAARKAAAPIAGGAVEVVGGSTGEVAGRLAAGQEMDVKEIGFEGFAGLGSAPLTVLPTAIKNINIVSGRVDATKKAKEGGYENVASAFKPDTKVDETTIELASKKNTSNIVDEQVEIEVANGRMKDEEADAIKLNFRDTQGAVNTANKIDRLTPENKTEAVELLIEEGRLKEKIKDVDNAALTKTESERLKEVQARLEEISNPKEEVVSEEKPLTEEETGVPITPEEPVSVETAPAEESIPQEALEELEQEVQSRESQGNLLDNANKEEKVYLNGKEGNIRIDPTNENTIIFESGDEIIELGNKDEVGSEPIAGFGLTTMPPEGLDVQAETMDADVVSVDGKQYNVIGRRRDKKGKAVVKVKEVGTGLIRRIKGAKAERVLKDFQLKKERKETPLPLTTEGKEVTTPTKKERRAERVAEKRKAREEYDKKSLDELSQMEEESQRSVQEFEEMALEEAAQESKNKDLVQVGENIFQVTKNDDGSFSVSQMNESGRLIGTRDEGKRRKAIGVFKSKKSNQEKRALDKAEKLIDEFKKEELQRIDDAINERLSARQQKAEGSKPAFNERIAAPESIVTSALKVLRNSYASGMTIMQSIDDALSFIEEQGFSANEFYFKKFVLDTLKTPKPKETTKTAPKTKAAPTKTTKSTAKERVLSKFGKGRVQSKVRKQVENARKSLSKIAKGVTIEVYETQAEFEAATNGDTVSRGIYDPSTKTIKINLEKANLRTVAHEVFHALLLKDGITNERAQKITSDMLNAVRKVASPKLLKELDAFSSKYDNGLQSEESIAELFGILAENYESSPQSVKDLINSWLRKLAKILNVPVEGILDSDKQVLEFLDVVSGKVARGEVIEQSDIQIIQDVDNGVPIENTYIDTNGGIVIDTDSKKRRQLEGSVINESDIIETSSLNGRPLEIVYYDNFTSSPYSLTNRVSGSSLNKIGEGGPAYSYRKEIKDAGIVAAFTTVTKGLNLIQGVSSRNKIAGDDAVIGVTLQNKETGHLGNKTTARDFYSPNPSEGVIALAVSDNVLTEIEAVGMLKDAVDAYSNTAKGKDSKSSLPFNSDDFNSISEFYDRILNTSFERRGTFNLNAIPAKSDLRINKSTKPYIKKWLDSGITTLLDYYESTQEPYTKEAMPHDIVKYISPNLNRIGVDPSVEVTNAERDRAKSMGVKIETVDENLMHTSYPVVIFGENVGIPSRFNSVREMSKDWDAPNPFFKAGRRPDTAQPVLIRQQKIDKELSKASGTTQVATTTGSYVKAAKILDTLEKGGEVLDYGAGLGLGTDAMSEVLGNKVDSYELNPERWKGKNPVTYTKSGDINKKYDAVVSLNVVNVVPKNIRDFILEDIYDKLKTGGVAVISSRAFKNDIANAKNFEKGVEDKSYIIKRKKDGETIDVYQKGFDGNELVEYVQDLLGDKVNVSPNNTFGQRGVIIEKIGDDSPKTRQQKVQDDYTIQDVIEASEQEGLTRKETIEVLQELGFTKDEIRGAMKPVKKKPRSVESETTGLSPREAFKQGFTEFFDAIQRGKKEARQKAAENLKEKVNKIRESFKKRLQKERDNKDARAAVVKEIRDIIKESGLSQFSKTTINKIMTNVKNANVNNMQRMVDEVMDVVNRDIDRRVRAARIKTLKAARKKLSRLGALKELQNPLMEVLSINPDYLSKSALSYYDRVITNLANVENKFDSRDSRENLKNNAEEVIKRFTSDNARAEKLVEDTINPNLDLTKTKGENLKQMLKDGLISDSDFELMTRFKDLIGSTTKEELTLEELEQKAKERREAAIEDFEVAMDEIPSSLPNLSKDDSEAVRFANSLKTKDLESLSTAQIKMLTRGLEMLQAGFVTTNLVQSKLLVEANRGTTETLINEIKERGKVDKAISSAKVFVKNLFRKRGDMITSIENRIKSTPLANIDQILNASAKKFKSTRIFETIFRPAGVAFNKTETFLEDTKKKLQKADSFLDSNNNTRWVQKAKVMLYQIQREYESNPRNKEVNTALKYANATINDEGSNLSDREKKYLQKLIDEFSVDGQIDSKKLLESFTDKEKKYLAAVDDIYSSVEEMVAADAKMQGKPFVRRKNYVHLPKVTKSENSMSDDLNEIANTFTNPALKNKALTQRTGEAHAISFDPTFNANGIANKAAISYYMYPAVKKAKITLAGVKQKAETDFQKEVAEALENVFDGIVKSQYSRLSRDRAFIEKALAFLGRTGYLAQLAGPVKAAVELTTNITHAAFTNPNNLISGFNTLREVPRGVVDKAFGYLPSAQGRRITGDGVKDSKEIEGRLISDSNNLFQEEQMTSEIRANVNKLFRFAKKPFEKIIKFNEDLIAKPDTIVARPVFVGAFNASFENIANEKPNWEKIANDQAYRDKFREAINQATIDGDAAVVDNAASNNPFEGIPRNIVDKDATATKQAIQMIDRYMTRFRTFEYYSALKGIQGLMGKGKLTPTQGAMLLTATVVRLSLYKMGIDMVFSMIFSMMGIDEEEDEIEFDKDLTKGVIGAVATLALGRSFGNISQMPINYGTEWLNKEYGEGITRSGEYNQYDDGIVFSKIPMEVKPQDNMVEKIITSSLGSYTPMTKTLTRAGKLAVRAKTLKTEEARERNFGELTTRIPFEIAGNMGVIPGYKSIRKIYNQYLFKGIKDSKTTDGRFKKSTREPRKSTREPRKSTR